MSVEPPHPSDQDAVPEPQPSPASAGAEALDVNMDDPSAGLSADLSGGHVRGDSRVQWYIPDTSINGNEQQLRLAEAAQGNTADVLDSLLPTHPQYAGLKRALAATAPEDLARRDLIRANMERWRWMPRDLGERHVIVNVPAFTAAVVDNGRVTVRHRAVVGARRTPTPQLSATISAVTLNPWWNVPQSIVREMGGRFGGDYVVRRDGGTIIARQRPGQLIGASVERAVRHPIGADDVGSLVAAHGGVAAEDVAQQQHDYLSSIRISR